MVDHYTGYIEKSYSLKTSCTMTMLFVHSIFVYRYTSLYSSLMYIYFALLPVLPGNFSSFSIQCFINDYHTDLGLCWLVNKRLVFQTLKLCRHICWCCIESGHHGEGTSTQPSDGRYTLSSSWAIALSTLLFLPISN